MGGSVDLKQFILGIWWDLRRVDFHQWAVLFTTCQVRVSRFYQRCIPPPPSTSPPANLNCELPIWVGTAGPQLQAGSQRALPYLNRGHCRALNRELQGSVGTAGPQLQAGSQRELPYLNRGHCQALNRELQGSVGTAGPLAARSRSQWALPSTCAHWDLALGWGPAVPMSERMSD